jgi:hypothetical protein
VKVPPTSTPIRTSRSITSPLILLPRKPTVRFRSFSMRSRSPRAR